MQLAMLPKSLRPKGKLKKNELNPIKRWNIVTGDKVMVTGGPEHLHGQTGIVLAVLREKKRVIVEGVNMRMKHLKQRYWESKGQSFMAPASMHYSNVNLIDPVTGEATRVKRAYLEDGTKVRIAKRSGAIIEKPAYKPERPKNIVAGPKDTPAEDVLEVTYQPFTDFGSLDPLPEHVLRGEDADARDEKDGGIEQGGRRGRQKGRSARGSKLFSLSKLRRRKNG